MTPLLSLSRRGALFAVAVQCLAASLPAQAGSDHSRVDITGDYRYAYHQPETASEAKQHACAEALHQAISTSAAVREHTASIVDSKLFHTLVHTLAAQHVTDRQILQQSEQGRTVYCKVKAVFEADAVERVLVAQSTNGSEQVLDQNRALKILNAHEEADGTLVITYQARKRLDWLGTAYQGGLREAADVMVDFYDEQGILVRSSRHPARKSAAAGDDVMNPGEIGTLKLAKPLNAKTFRVWVVK
jgi:hypothetical protein